MMTHISYLLILLLIFSSALAQDTLTFDKALQLAVAYNYDIRLARYDTEISSNNVSRGIAGQLPRLTHNVSYERGQADAEIQTLGLDPGSGENTPLELSGSTQTISIQPELTMTLFSGFRGKYRYEQLENLDAISQLRLRNQIEQTMAQVASAYLNIVQLQNQLTIDQENIALSYDRYLRAVEDARFGAANSVQRLQAEVDLKTDSTQYRNTKLTYETSIRNLNILLGLPSMGVYSVEEVIMLADLLDYEALEADLIARNTTYQLAEKGIDDARYNLKLTESDFFPYLQGYANYTYLNNDNEANFLQQNTVYGPNVGVRMSFTLYDGGNRKIRHQNAKVAVNQQETRLDFTELSLVTRLDNTYTQYQNYRDQLRIEKGNLITFERNFEKTAEDYRLGQVDATVLRTAQLNLTRAKNRINTLTYQIKETEIQLLHLSGRLLQIP